MAEATNRRHGLETFLVDAPRDEEPGVEIRVIADCGFVNLRGSTDEQRFVDQVATILGNRLPGTPNTFATGDHRAYWLGPDEWLIATTADGAERLCEHLEVALDGVAAASNDVSGGYAALRLSGPSARELLAAGCPLDLHPGVFRPGNCAQSGLARASVLLALLDESPEFEIIVRRSLADYLARWLAHVSRRIRRSFIAD